MDTRARNRAYRELLKQRFPRVRFTVSANRRDITHVTWMDGPPEHAVTQLLGLDPLSGVFTSRELSPRLRDLLQDGYAHLHGEYFDEDNDGPWERAAWRLVVDRSPYCGKCGLAAEANNDPYCLGVRRERGDHAWIQEHSNV